MRSLLLLGVALISSCSLFEDEKVETARSESNRLVGRIALVPSEGEFVLIESYGPWRVPEGGLLTGVGTEGRTSNLVVTGEKLGQHAAADIRSGVAKVGDSVYHRLLKGQTEPNPVDSPALGPDLPELETQKPPLTGP